VPSGSLNDALAKPEKDNPTGGFGVRVADIENDIDVNKYMLLQPQALDRRLPSLYIQFVRKPRS
jgi:hypothetical protein